MSQIILSNYAYFDKNNNIKTIFLIGKKLKKEDFCTYKQFHVLSPNNICLLMYYNNTNYWILDDNFSLACATFENFFSALEYVTNLKKREPYSHYLVDYKILTYDEILNTKIKKVETTEEYHKL